MFCQIFAVSPPINNLVDLCNNSKVTFFLGDIFFDLEISFIYPKNACLLCAICGKVTAFFPLSPNHTVQSTFLNKQVCPRFINIIIENYPSYSSGAKSTLCNVAMKVYPLSSHILN